MTTFTLPKRLQEILEAHGAPQMFTFSCDASRESWEWLVQEQLLGDDGSRRHILEFAVLWACLMEARILKGDVCDGEMQGSCDKVADVYGLSGGAYGCARGVLKKHWKYGVYLR